MEIKTGHVWKKDATADAIKNEKGQIEVVAGTKHQFYVKLKGIDKPVSVNIMMPVGGPETGLFRFPRLGEKVVIACGASEGNYLLGYVPDDDSNKVLGSKAADKEKLQDKFALSLRYQQPKGSDGTYSEISFYQEPLECERTKDTKKEIIGEKLDIKSSGDINIKSASAHLVKAGRMELLLNCPEIDHKTGKDVVTGELPLGDVPGDNSELEKGDFHLRAGNRIVLKAGSEIQLQVGRTILSITDGGCNIITKKVNSNWPNTYDTQLSLKPRGGISMSGDKVEIEGARKVLLQDKMGGGIGSCIGAVSIDGRQIDIANMDNAEWKVDMAFSDIEFLMNSVIAGLGLNNNKTEYNEKAIEIIDLAKDFTLKLQEFIRYHVGWRAKHEELDPQGPSTTKSWMPKTQQEHNQKIEDALKKKEDKKII
ncbi:MAG: hypothetical protein LBD07_03610 [Spirochaetaceae bacterium]|jgi:hypothetical protein|nr:hypothetical protein [Spirochaetaceae bacterium]